MSVVIVSALLLAGTIPLFVSVSRGVENNSVEAGSELSDDEYCDFIDTDSDDTHITSIDVPGITMHGLPDEGGLIDHTDQVSDPMEAGETYEFSVTVDYDAAVIPTGVSAAAHIDYDQNIELNTGQNSSAEGRDTQFIESVSTDREGAHELEGEISIPSDAVGGETRMRITGTVGQGHWYCDSDGTSGEAYDFTAYIDSDVVAEPFFEVDIDDDHPEEGVENEDATFNYTVENTGTVSDEQEIEFIVDDETLDSETVELGDGKSHTSGFTWDIEEGDAGQNEVEISSEDDDDNVFITVLPEHDFDIELDDYDTVVNPGDTVFVNYTVENRGAYEDTQDVEFIADDVVKDSNEHVLDRDDDETGSLTWSTEYKDTYSITISSDDDSEDFDLVVDEDGEFSLQLVDYDSEVVVGDSASIEYNVTNIGGLEETQDVSLIIDNDTVDTHTVTLDGDEVENKEFEWSTEEDDIGEQNFSVECEDDNIQESIVVLEDAFFDVEVVEYDEWNKRGENLSFTYNITNTGDLSGVRDVEITIQYLEGDDIEEKTIEDLGLNSSESYQDTFKWNTLVIDEYEFLISSEDDEDSVEFGVSDEEPAHFEVNIINYPGEVLVGETGDVEFTITNTGDVDGESDVVVEFDNESIDEHFVELGPGEESEVKTASVDVPEIESYTFTISTEDEDKTVEIEGVETLFFAVDIEEPKDDDDFEPGEQVGIEYTVKNYGSGTDSQEITLEIKEVDGEVKEEDDEVFELGTDGKNDGWFVWNTEGLSEGVYTISVESLRDEDEVNITLDEEETEVGEFKIDITVPKDDGEVYEVEQTVTVEYEITNVADIDGTQEIVFKVDGDVLESENTTVLADESVTNTFMWDAELSQLSPDERELSVRCADDEDSVNITVVEDKEDYIPAEFSIEITEHPDEVDAGDSLTVVCSVNNTGEVRDKQNVTLIIDGEEVDEIVITLDPGEEIEIDDFDDWTVPDEVDETFSVEVESETHTDSVTIQVGDEDEGIFSDTLAVVATVTIGGAVLTVAALYKTGMIGQGSSGIGGQASEHKKEVDSKEDVSDGEESQVDEEMMDESGEDDQ